MTMDCVRASDPAVYRTCDTVFDRDYILSSILHDTMQERD